MSQTQLEPQSTSAAPATPRWVKITAIIVVVVILLFTALHLSGAHGPASHMTMSEQPTPAGEHTP